MCLHLYPLALQADQMGMGLGLRPSYLLAAPLNSISRTWPASFSSSMVLYTVARLVPGSSA